MSLQLHLGSFPSAAHPAPPSTPRDRHFPDTLPPTLRHNPLGPAARQMLQPRIIPPSPAPYELTPNPHPPPLFTPAAGEEIWRQTRGRVHAFVCGAGTGGTIAGVSRALKAHDPRVRVFLVDPPGSSLFNKVGKEEVRTKYTTEVHRIPTWSTL